MRFGYRIRLLIDKFDDKILLFKKNIDPIENGERDSGGCSCLVFDGADEESCVSLSACKLASCNDDEALECVIQCEVDDNMML
jgi:hypothetical protein